MNNNNLRQILKGNWNEIKGNIKSKWNKLTDDDIEQIDGSYEELTGKIQKLYGYKMNELENTLSEFFESNGFDKLKSKASNKFDEIKSAVWASLDEYFQMAKKGSIKTEKIVNQYAKENPYKLIGLAAACGLLLGCLYKNKN